MRTLESVNEFKTEAADAVFTKQQAVAATLQLLQTEKDNAENTPEETALFAKALAQAEFRYIDDNITQTDRMLDALGVAHYTTDKITKAIEDLVFDVQ